MKKRLLRSRRNPAGVPVTDALILVATGGIIGGIAYWLYSKSQPNPEAAATSVALPTGADVAGNATTATPPSAATGGVGVFSNVTPGPLGPSASGAIS